MKYAGAAYLVWLGAHAVWTALRARSAETTGAALAGRSGHLASLTALRQGVVSNLGNPKMVVFFASLLPQFAPASGPSFAALLSLGLVFCALTFAWLALYAAVVAKAGAVLLRPHVKRWIEGVTGAVLIALGLRIATESR